MRHRAFLLLLALLWAGGGRGWAAGAEARGEGKQEVPSPKAAGWQVAIEQGARLAEDLSDYPVRHDVFRRCGRILETARLVLLVSESSPPGPELPGFPDELKRSANEIGDIQEQVRQVVHEFGKGLEVSYEGAFSDFPARGEELAVLLGRLKDELSARLAKLKAAP